MYSLARRSIIFTPVKTIYYYILKFHTFKKIKIEIIVVYNIKNFTRTFIYDLGVSTTLYIDWYPTKYVRYNLEQ